MPDVTPASRVFMFARLPRLAILALALAAAACQSPTPASPPAFPGIRGAAVIGVAGRRNEHVTLAAHNRFVAAAWAATDAAGATDIYLVTSDDGGQMFGIPVRVNATAGDARANGEQPPRVVVRMQPQGPPEVVVVWLTRRDDDVLLLKARSIDGGRTFGESELVPGTDARGNRGWHALGVDRAGVVHAAWLDHRRIAPGPMAAHHQHGPEAMTAASGADTVAQAQLSDLYYVGLADDTRPRALTAGVCYCCKTAMAHGPDGTIYLAWRHVYRGNMRDIAFAVSRDGGRTFSAPLRVSEDGWSVAGCPDDGPALAVDAGGAVHVVWPTMVTAGDKATKRLFHAMTVDGQIFTPRVAVPHVGDAHHPQVATLADGTVVAMWDEFQGSLRRVARALGTRDPSGAIAFSLDPAIETMDAVDARYPVVAATEGGGLAAWTSGPIDASVIRASPFAIRSR